jgi:ribosomal protein S18 acetylase RimI-like enzyme
VSAPQLREATAQDAEAIIALNRRAWREGFRGIVSEDPLPGNEEWRASLVKSIASDDPSTLVAELDRTVRGFVTVGSSRDGDAPPDAGEVRALHVDPATWRQGIGSALMEGALTRLRERGYRQVTLWSFERNLRSRCFYEALGFRPDGARQRRFRSDNAAEIRYRRALAQPPSS